MTWTRMMSSSFSVPYHRLPLHPRMQLPLNYCPLRPRPQLPPALINYVAVGVMAAPSTTGTSSSGSSPPDTSSSGGSRLGGSDIGWGDHGFADPLTLGDMSSITPVHNLFSSGPGGTGPKASSMAFLNSFPSSHSQLAMPAEATGVPIVTITNKESDYMKLAGGGTIQTSELVFPSFPKGGDWKPWRKKAVTALENAMQWTNQVIWLFR